MNLEQENRKSLQSRVLGLSSDSSKFDDLALDIFRFQYSNSSVYRQYVELLNMSPESVQKIEEIPFLPVEAFKHNKVISGEFEGEIVFRSSGTTADSRSKHYVRDVAWYDKVSDQIFSDQIGDIRSCVFVGLLPGYLERGDSSLVHMVHSFMQKDELRSDEVRFFINDFNGLVRFLEKVDSKVVLFGVTHAILSWVESNELELSSEIQSRLTIIETGGMKGHGAEPIRAEVHSRIKAVLPEVKIASEYGMTELLSQAYSVDGRYFTPPTWMKVMLVDTSDPRAQMPEGKTGRLHIIDLANIDSCSFLSTSDLGRSEAGSNRFEILGRFDHSEVRGCNLLHTN